jgi:hypothetical protein
VFAPITIIEQKRVMLAKIEKVLVHTVPCPYTGNYKAGRERRVWCLENIGPRLHADLRRITEYGIWYPTSDMFYFEKASDAMLFKLKFG